MKTLSKNPPYQCGTGGAAGNNQRSLLETLFVTFLGKLVAFKLYGTSYSLALTLILVLKWS